MNDEQNACGLFKDRVLTTEEWKAKHSPHSDEFKSEPFKGPHDWHWLVCECGAKHLEPRAGRDLEGPK